jgi:tryptophan synthase alpha chain
MSAIDTVFLDLKRSGRKAFIPFVTAGDPDLEFTVNLIRELSRRGSSICELGIPYSDPIADGPVIQSSYTRALDNHIKLNAILKAIEPLKAVDLSMPLVTMVSYAIIYRHGLERYVEEAREAGVSGAIVPDLPVEESDALAKICRQVDFSLIQLVTPTTAQQRALRIAETSSGFLYYVSVTGITGERRDLPTELVDNVSWLKEQTDLPICIGFGVSAPGQIRLIKPVADGIIVGSALVRRIADIGRRGRAETLADIGQFADEMLAELE